MMRLEVWASEALQFGLERSVIFTIVFAVMALGWRLLGKRRTSHLGSLWFALQFFWASQQLVVMPTMVRAYTTADNFGFMYGLVKSTGAILVMATQLSVGFISDHAYSKLGRRRPFIAYGTVPLIVSFALIWTPPGGTDNVWNIVWLLVVGTSFFTLFSVVVNPYLAMLPDIARTEDDRVTTSAMLAAFGLSAEVVTMVAPSVPPITINIGARAKMDSIFPPSRVNAPAIAPSDTIIPIMVAKSI